jgi:two-component system phosphate regulon sensor histidine kinase PhoR
MFPQRLLGQLLLANLALILVLMVLGAVYAGYTARWLYLERISAELASAGRLGAVRLAHASAESRGSVAQAVCDELAAASGARVTVMLASGQVAADSNEDPRLMDNHGDRPEMAHALEGAIGHSTRYSNTLRQQLMYVAVPAVRDGKVVAVVRASMPLIALARTLNAVYLRLAVGGTLVALTLGLVSLWTARRILRPLEIVRVGAQRFARGELGHRLTPGGPCEMRELAEALNRMAQELDTRIRTILCQQDEHEAMLASMEEGVLAVDTSGRIVSLNEACARLLGGTVASLAGCLLHGAVRKPGLLRFIDQALEANQSLDDELQFPGDPDRWLHAHAAALHDAEGRRTGVLIVLYDMTRLRQLENLRRDFVANVSHELRTPITSIKGFVETLLDEEMTDSDNALRFLEIIHRQVNRLEAIIADLLSLSRIERGAEGQTIPLEPAPLGDVLRAACEMCLQKAAEKQITIDIECPADLAANLNAPLLEQAVVNLLDNAIKYSDPHATVRVKAEREGAGTKISVSDEGCGIAPQHLPRLFERFYRVDKARSRELGGTGLGLSIVKHIMAAHRGSVAVESVVGRGSTFTLRLPPLAADASTAGVPAPCEEESPS